MLKQSGEWQSILSRKSFATICAAVLIFASAGRAYALTITGTLSTGMDKYLLTGSVVNVSTNTVLKISFETLTAGDNLSLCAGTDADFTAGHCPTRLNISGGPGFTFLTIVDAASLNGKQLYVIRNVGINAASFRVTIE
jgi:hypothetical protein